MPREFSAGLRRGALPDAAKGGSRVGAYVLKTAIFVIFSSKTFGSEIQVAMRGALVASWCIFIIITALLGHINTTTTKKLEFKNSNMTSVGASN